jgi:predicted NAD/FAD-binding protein
MSGRRIAVVGSGVSGITAGYVLAQKRAPKRHAAAAAPRERA